MCFFFGQLGKLLCRSLLLLLLLLLLSYTITLTWLQNGGVASVANHSFFKTYVGPVVPRRPQQIAIECFVHRNCLTVRDFTEPNLCCKVLSFEFRALPCIQAKQPLGNRLWDRCQRMRNQTPLRSLLTSDRK